MDEKNFKTLKELLDNSRDTMAIQSQLVADIAKLRTIVGQQNEEISSLKSQAREVNEAPEPQKEERLMSRKEVAAFYGVTLATIHNWTKKRQIKPIYRGNRVYFKRSELTL